MSPKPKVYLETTIPSYFTAWRSRDLIMAANQETTREWWSRRKNDFDFFVSQAVIKESGAGDLDAAKRRLDFLRPFPLLDKSDEVESCAPTTTTLARPDSLRTVIKDPVQEEAFHESAVGSAEDRGVGAANCPLR